MTNERETADEPHPEAERDELAAEIDKLMAGEVAFYVPRPLPRWATEK